MTPPPRPQSFRSAPSLPSEHKASLLTAQPAQAKLTPAGTIVPCTRSLLSRPCGPILTISPCAFRNLLPYFLLLHERKRRHCPFIRCAYCQYIMRSQSRKRDDCSGGWSFDRGGITIGARYVCSSKAAWVALHINFKNII